MRNKNLKNYIHLILIYTAFINISCKKIYIDPNRANPTNVLTTEQGLTALTIGIQRTYTLSSPSPLYTAFTINGLTTGELFVVNPGNTAEVQLQTGGGSVDFTNTILNNYWSNNIRVITDANSVINNAPKWTNKNYASGLIAYASIFKALAIGNLSMFWEKVPDTVGNNVNFISRIDGFKKAVQILDNAIALIITNPPPTNFNRNIPSVTDPSNANTFIPFIDLKNTLYALKARYALFAGDSLTAFNAANNVDLSKKSTFNFEAANPNPVSAVATSTNNVVQVIDSTFGLSVSEGLAPATNDKRIGFYTSINATIAPRFRIKGFGASNTTSIPIYLPGEMILIKAEYYTRIGDTTNGKNQLNMILTKTPTTDIYGVGADLPPITNIGSKDSLLLQIYRNRCIELYMSGLKLEDMRRFGRKVTPPNAEVKRNFMPYPFSERDNNKNVPPDPTF